jgi:hypothetical protein
MIEMRRAQRSFGDGLIAEEVADLCEDWMAHADQLLDDEQIVTSVYEGLAQRHPHSRRRGRLGAPAEMVLRLLILKHARNWSYGVLEREVRANLRPAVPGIVEILGIGHVDCTGRSKSPPEADPNRHLRPIQIAT